MKLYTFTYNTLFVAFLQHTHGQYTEEHIQRASRIVGRFGKHLEQVYITELAGTKYYRKSQEHQTYADDIPKFNKGK